MLKYSKGQKISINLQLNNSDGTSETGAIISYDIYDSTYTLELSGGIVSYNSSLNAYVDIIDPSTDWINQTDGMYFVKWSISNTVEKFPNTATEELYIEPYEEKLDEIITNTESLSGSSSTSCEGISNILSKVESLSADMNTEFDGIENKLDIIDNNVDDILSNTESLSANLSTIGDNILRLLGICHENVYIDNTVYDSYGNLESARLRIYSDSVSVGTDNNVIATYEINANTTDIGRFSTWNQKRL